ncbi:DNA polymerase III subunits gamma and tau [hydrothermal vent metagenome]|uniref:DNA-directed DNA polymerase n=1 Tax=hydrothermal vent metagenome TaxID=652676 RepID=A0A1W1DML1_9ZZZZ
MLARKYRPHTFGEMVGQTHTVKTLINALDANNLHHGFLFTGTRGVGKTTIARIFAKSINCEQGVSSTPCGQCATCLEIDKGQSVDLIELDAASHTGVDNMRDILENAQYMPTKNRYKIYLIDEVHMLSKSSFNALLKTLEEPPEHIKFLLATTDPQKLPVTVLSRCLQFTLQKLTHEEILGQLKFIMEAEGLEYEELALSQIADFGNGSMRDALSLLDQSISYGNGTVMTKDIKAMLGLVHHDDIIALATHLFNQDAQAVINLTSLFHQISIAQIIDNTQIADEIKALATQISNQDLQLFYHMAINGTKDMPLAPSEQIGFEMTLLRMLAFHSETVNSAEKKTAKIAPKPKAKVTTETKSKPTAKPKVAKEKAQDTPKASLNISSQQEWEGVTKSLKFNTAMRMLLKNTLFDSVSERVLTLTLDEQFSNLLTERIQLAIQTTLQAHFGELTLKINLDKPTTQTLAQKETQANNEKKAAMQKAFLNDEGVKKLQETFNAKVDINSIQEIENV